MPRAGAHPARRSPAPWQFISVHAVSSLKAEMPAVKATVKRFTLAEHGSPMRSPARFELPFNGSNGRALGCDPLVASVTKQVMIAYCRWMGVACVGAAWLLQTQVSAAQE